MKKEDQDNFRKENEKRNENKENSERLFAEREKKYEEVE
jgi:hypothetical protein